MLVMRSQRSMAWRPTVAGQRGLGEAFRCLPGDYSITIPSTSSTTTAAGPGPRLPLRCLGLTPCALSMHATRPSPDARSRHATTSSPFAANGIASGLHHTTGLSFCWVVAHDPLLRLTPPTRRA